MFKTYIVCYGSNHREVCIVDVSDLSIQYRIDFGPDGASRECRLPHLEGDRPFNIWLQEVSRTAQASLSRRFLRVIIDPDCRFWFEDEEDLESFRHLIGPDFRAVWLQYPPATSSSSSPPPDRYRCAVAKVLDIAARLATPRDDLAIKFSSKEEELKYLCVICTQQMFFESITLTRCSHHLHHKTCLHKWICEHDNNTCYVCRSKISRRDLRRLCRRPDCHWRLIGNLTRIQNVG
ncbi:putative ring finger protein 122 [Lasius niger]|uniref:Putative ring finger protein 122 n=1 Tax=Lasius niger TaxID=67767 RepID=A0A0J7JWH7_LASNI|nr:putative ring finger protein 122 [Lasius niger]